jgi:hypothetical protein
MADFKYQMHVMSKLMIVICVFCNLKHSIIIVSFQFEENKIMMLNNQKLKLLPIIHFAIVMGPSSFI